MTTTTKSSAKTERPAMSELDLRDYFAAKAMQGVIAQACGTALGSDPKYAADYAYAAADAMIAEREATP